MSVVRGDQPSDHFLILHNATARDRRLSFRARGVLAFVLSLPPGGRTTVEAITAEGTEGREAIRKAMAELEANGYVERVIVRGNAGRIRTDTVVYGSPRAPKEDRPPAHRPPAHRPPETRSPVPPAQTQETAGQTGTQETGLRSTGSVKKKTGTTENGTENGVCAGGADAFAAFWDCYPQTRRGTRVNALSMWTWAQNGGGATAQDLADGLAAWCEHWRRDAVADRYIPEAENWLRRRRWSATPPAPAPATPARSASGAGPRFSSAAERRQARSDAAFDLVLGMVADHETAQESPTTSPSDPALGAITVKELTV